MKILIRENAFISQIPINSGLSLYTSIVTLRKRCYFSYITFVAGWAPSYKEYVQKLELKMQDEEFLTDVLPLLRSEITYDALVDRLSGRRDLAPSANQRVHFLF